eukprot:7874520-Lingulodinium_polyedra.AAC.1
MEENSWYFGLTAMNNSSVLVWPCAAVQVEDQPGNFFLQLSTDVTKPHIIAIFDVDNFEAMSVEWQCPAAQLRLCRKTFQTLGAGLRLFP